MTFETVRKFQALTDLNFFVKYTDSYGQVESFSGSNSVSVFASWP
jgi:hypothetical protein